MLTVATIGSDVHGRAAIGPRSCRLELRGDAQEQVFAPVRGHELRSDRQRLRVHARGNEIAGEPAMFASGV